MILNEQCDFADGIYNCQGLSKVYDMKDDQMMITILGDNWEELPYSIKGMVRMCHSDNHLAQLQQQIKISDHCSETERHQLVKCTF